jgi:hypothetical protein
MQCADEGKGTRVGEGHLVDAMAAMPTNDARVLGGDKPGTQIR